MRPRSVLLRHSSLMSSLDNGWRAALSAASKNFKLRNITVRMSAPKSTTCTKLLNALPRHSSQLTGRCSQGTKRIKSHSSLTRFLAATRACIDLVSAMLALHIKGMDRKTGSTELLKMSERNPTSPFSDLLKKWKDWIGEV